MEDWYETPLAALDPEELFGAPLQRRLGRYSADAVDALLAQARASYEHLWTSARSSREDAQRAEAELRHSRELSDRIGDALLVAEQAASERRRRAEREAQETLASARAAAARLVADARAEREALQGEIERLRALWRDLRVNYRAFLIAALQLAEADENEQFDTAAHALRAEAARRADAALARLMEARRDARSGTGADEHRSAPAEASDGEDATRGDAAAANARALAAVAPAGASDPARNA